MSNLMILTNPEILMTFGILIILMVSVFLKKNSFNFSLYSSIFLLVIIIFFIVIDYQILLKDYKLLFAENLFIKTIKLIIIFSSILVLLIIENYFKDLDIAKFEIPILLLFSTLGMMIMISSNNIMTMYLGIELQSLSLYVLATIQKDTIKSSEAGLKYFILGALASSFLLYGFSLIYGFTGSLDFNEIHYKLNNLKNLNIGITFGLIFVITALSFKVSAVPFHMWTPDVYEGSPTPITAFFAMVPKIAAVAILTRFLLGPFGNFWFEWNQIIIFISISSMIVGAMAAIVQTNIKRLLAYSSIGHIGYILIGLACGSDAGVRAIIIYLCIYISMNAAIFAIILSFKSKNQYIENINSISGLGKKYPIISIVLTIMMFSMAGIPPFAGFFGKFYIFTAAIESKLFALAVIGVLSSVVAAFYYIRIIKVIYFEEPVENLEFSLNNKIKFVISFSFIFIVFFIFFQSPIIELSRLSAISIF